MFIECLYLITTQLNFTSNFLDQNNRKSQYQCKNTRDFEVISKTRCRVLLLLVVVVVLLTIIIIIIIIIIINIIIIIIIIIIIVCRSSGSGSNFSESAYSPRQRGRSGATDWSRRSVKEDYGKVCHEGHQTGCYRCEWLFTSVRWS